MATTADHVGYASWLKQDHLIAFDVHAQVVVVASRPFWMHCNDHQERDGTHPPILCGDLMVAVDVRADDRIEDRDVEVFGAHRDDLSLCGLGYRRPCALRTAVVGLLSPWFHSQCRGCTLEEQTVGPISWL